MVKSKAQSKNFEKGRQASEITLDKKKKQHASYYEIEQIVDAKVVNGEKKYLVKWVNFSSDFNTWEPQNSFPDLSMIEKFQTLREQSSKNYQQHFPFNKEKKLKRNRFIGHTKIDFLTKKRMPEFNTSEMSIIKQDEHKEIMPSEKEEEIKCASPQAKQNEVEHDSMEKENRMDEENQSSESSDPFEVEAEDTNKNEQNRLKSKSRILKKSKRRAFMKRNGLDEKNIVENAEKDRQKRKKGRPKKTLMEMDDDKGSVECNEKGSFYDERVYYEMVETERGVGKQVLYQFKEGNQNMFRIELNTQEKINLSQESARVFFPRLLIDHYKKIIKSLATSNYD